MSGCVNMIKMRKLFPRIFNTYHKTNYTTFHGGDVIVEKLGNIMTIGINRPDKRNCISIKTADNLKRALEDFENDSESLAAVLYGTGGNFCSGFDLKELSTMSEQQMENSFNNGLLGLPGYIKKPTVAAINGYAVGEGFELALMCDLRVMEENAVLGFYSQRFGLPLTEGGTVRLQAMVGLTRALEMILTGRSVNAKDALQWGLVNRVVACGTALGQGINVATSITKFPQDSINVDRTSTYKAAYNKALNDVLLEEKGSARSVLIKNAVEGARKFLKGIGKHGKFYRIKEKSVEDWEREFVDEIKPKSKL